jgi:hypothetical protein
MDSTCSCGIVLSVSLATEQRVDTVIDFVSGACALGFLVVATAIVRPWGPFRLRWHAVLVALALIVGGTALFQMAPERPTNVTQAEWDRRIALCRAHAVGAFRSCVQDPNEFHKSEVAAKQAEVAAKSQANLLSALPNASAPPSSSITSKWEYTEERDAMRGSITKHATLESENEVEFGFPYSGGSHGGLDVRQRPQDGLQVLLSVTSGNFSCSPMGGRIAVKFDNGAVQTFPCSRTTDINGNVVFVGSPKRFVAELRRSSTVVVEAEFFQEGMRQFTFDVRGLIWK